MIKPRLQIIEVEFDVSVLSDALHISEDEVVTAFSDGRGAWPFSEFWGQRLFEFAKHVNSNEPLSDGLLALERLGDLKVSIKALTKAGVKFQQSKFVGFGRNTTKNDLISSLEACDRVVVVDIASFPKVDFVPLDTQRLISAAHRGELTKSGWSKSKFSSWIDQTYAAEWFVSEI